MRGRLGEALHAGFNTLLTGLLVAAALAAPKLSSEPDFAHSHVAGTHHHLHPLELILGSGPAPLPTIAPFTERFFSSLVQPPVLPWVSALSRTLPRSRAPPAPRQTL